MIFVAYYSHKGGASGIIGLFTACGVAYPSGWLEIPTAPGLEVRHFGHGKRRGVAREEVAVVLAIGHALRAHEALGRPDALSGILEVVHRLFEDGVFVGHDRSIRTVSSDHSIVSRSRVGRVRAGEEASRTGS